MPQFLVLGHDSVGSGAAARRSAKQPDHRNGLKRLIEDSHLLLAGPAIGEDGQTIGSVMVMEFETRTQLDAWLAIEPYVVGEVWERVDVIPMRITVPAPQQG